MPQRLGPRFAIEAIFIVLVAVAAGLARLSTLVIVLVIAAAWALVVLTELIAAREPPSSFAPSPLLERHASDEAELEPVEGSPVYPPWQGEPERAEAQTLLGAVVPVDPEAPVGNGEGAGERDPWEQGPEPAVEQPQEGKPGRVRAWFRRRGAPTSG